MTKDPAHFIPFGNGHYLPANRMAVSHAEEISKMHLSDDDLLALKGRGVHVTLTNGEPIELGVMA